MGFIDEIKKKAKADLKTIVLPETEDRRTYEAAAQILKEEIADRGFDMMIMRELTGGLYFGKRSTQIEDGVTVARDELTYSEEEIRRIAAGKREYLPLLLDADPSEAMIDEVMTKAPEVVKRSNITGKLTRKTS